MKAFTLYRSDTREDENNTVYPIECCIDSVESLQRAASFDHVPCKFKNDHRAKADFISSDVVILDLDNTHCDDPESWKRLDDISETFEDVEFYYIQSRNYMQPKGGREPREKFHIYFPVNRIDDPKEYELLITRIGNLFPYFDEGCKDIAHFFYGVSEAKGGCYE